MCITSQLIYIFYQLSHNLRFNIINNKLSGFTFAVTTRIQFIVCDIKRCAYAISKVGCGTCIYQSKGLLIVVAAGEPEKGPWNQQWLRYGWPGSISVVACQLFVTPQLTQKPNRPLCDSWGLCSQGSLNTTGLMPTKIYTVCCMAWRAGVGSEQETGRLELRRGLASVKLLPPPTACQRRPGCAACRPRLCPDCSWKAYSTTFFFTHCPPVLKLS